MRIHTTYRLKINKELSSLLYDRQGKWKFNNNNKSLRFMFMEI